MIGQFLEISLHTEDIARSVAFYRQLGFTPLVTGEIWSHPYGVLSDGRIHIGLHAYPFQSPSLTFVRPGLREHVDDLKARGVRFEFLKTGDDEFNELGFLDPGGQMVTLVEARTYSPAGFGECPPSRLGTFDCFSMPAAHLMESAGFWQRLGLVETDDLPELDDYATETMLVSRGFRLRLHVLPSTPRLNAVFRGEDLESRLGALADDGFDVRPAPVAAGGAVLVSPEGLELLLLGAD